ncbi:MAG TPA: glycosyltransferase family protein [Burkholderiales bacterium]|nr:glycosyltransferase family protein [Burkholderiales bacterium]
MNAVAIIQARMGSTRLPGKVLRTLGTKSVLAHVVERVKRCSVIDAVVVATTSREADDAVEEEARAHGAAVFRGSEEDVLDRYHGAARRFGADTIVRITSDCPLLDASLTDAIVRRFLAARDGLDYLSNTLVRTYPRGLDTEVFSFAALDAAQREAREPHQREHVTPYIWEHPERFRVAQHTGTPDRSALRWTLDTEEDWRFLAAVFAAAGGAPGDTQALVELLERRPELAAINAHVEQKRSGPGPRSVPR